MLIVLNTMNKRKDIVDYYFNDAYFDINDKNNINPGKRQCKVCLSNGKSKYYADNNRGNSNLMKHIQSRHPDYNTVINNKNYPVRYFISNENSILIMIYLIYITKVQLNTITYFN
mmetsp:Transcript_14821/g.13409  ORF Transcript_14821/g.13409 Transcript_14821/m.13409 type:complete len:115 (+) Transcript_14821:11-355(+)